MENKSQVVLKRYINVISRNACRTKAIKKFLLDNFP